MQSFTLIIDAPFQAPGADAPCSTLLMPMGDTTVCERIARSLPLSSMDEVLVLAAAGVDTPGYAEHACNAIDHDHVRLIRGEELPAFLASCEPEDELYAVDARRYPECGYGEVLSMIGRNGYRGAAHAVSIGTNRRARERVDCDAAGRIRRVSRLYAGMDLPATANHAVLLSVLSPRAILPTPPATLPEFRNAVITGGHFSRDIPVATSVVDLSTPAGLLRANKRLLLGRNALTNPAAAEYALREDQVWLARKSDVDAGARLIGPVIVHAGARIAKGAAVIGPAVIGAGADIGPDAKVVQAMAPERILCVDDDPDARNLLQIALSTVAGFDVMIVGSAEAAFSRFNQFDPDLLVLDDRMPGIDGERTIQLLHIQAADRVPPFVFLTAMVDPRNLQRLASLGASAVVTKPFDPMTLGETLSDAYHVAIKA